ncbi:ABC transporter ATP-binding protein [uncultured Maricaulis sp.]|uniref:ABC transporter ATP-binding protein n=1 Tax=uncultured Maricaulis sp. TaxID=174710 RepID=UPI0030DC0315|tara:strand:+ start:26506 stop:27447 length:942 start_codon:yes stop_codon:yes gene_type:complete
MSYVSVRNLFLNYPLYQRAPSQGGAPAVPTGSEVADHGGGRNETLIRRGDGSVIGVRALCDVSFEAVSGDRVAIIGENGSGKTSLLQVLAGIYTPDAGEVVIEGRTTSVVNINLGMNLEATGHKNITLRGLAVGQTREAVEAKRAEIAAFSGLGDFLDLPVETYSAGMRMRLNFAIATAFKPDVLILDEWLSAGDTAFRRKATDRMRTFVDQAGILILASHSRSLMETTCNRAIWLDYGTIRAEGEVEAVAAAYDEEMARRQVDRDARAAAELEVALAHAEAAALQAQSEAASISANSWSNFFIGLMKRLRGR